MAIGDRGGAAGLRQRIPASPSPDGGPLRYRVVHTAQLWDRQAGSLRGAQAQGGPLEDPPRHGPHVRDPVKVNLLIRDFVVAPAAQRARA